MSKRRKKTIAKPDAKKIRMPFPGFTFSFPIEMQRIARGEKIMVAGPDELVDVHMDKYWEKYDVLIRSLVRARKLQEFESRRALKRRDQNNNGDHGEANKGGRSNEK